METIDLTNQGTDITMEEATQEMAKRKVKLPKHIIIDFTEEELKQLIKLLNKLEYSKDPKIAELGKWCKDIRDKADELQYVLDSVPAAQHMWFINIYETACKYGGPEEGGWSYMTYNCIVSEGYACLPTEYHCGPDQETFISDDFMELITAFIERCEYYDAPLPMPLNDTEDIEMFTARLLARNDIFAYRPGDDIQIAIERAPGKSHDIRREVYR